MLKIIKGTKWELRLPTGEIATLFAMEQMNLLVIYEPIGTYEKVRKMAQSYATLKKNRNFMRFLFFEIKKRSVSIFTSSNERILPVL